MRPGNMTRDRIGLMTILNNKIITNLERSVENNSFKIVKTNLLRRGARVGKKITIIILIPMMDQCQGQIYLNHLLQVKDSNNLLLEVAWIYLKFHPLLANNHHLKIIQPLINKYKIWRILT